MAILLRLLLVASRFDNNKAGLVSPDNNPRRWRALGWSAFGLTVGAFGYSLALLVGAFVAPVYSFVSIISVAPTGESAWTASSRLSGPAAFWVLMAAAVPAVIAAVVWAALHHRCSHAGSQGSFIAWMSIFFLGCFCFFLIAIFAFAAQAGIAVNVAPVVLLLVYAALLTPSGSPPAHAVA